MSTEMEIQIPEEVPAMVLPDVALFPQSLLPLRIFEPRYRRMLEQVLEGNRMMAVAGLASRLGSDAWPVGNARNVAGVGLVRASQKNADGTSEILVQGICRVEILRTVAVRPFRRLAVRPLSSSPGATPEENFRLRGETIAVLRLRQELLRGEGGALTDFLAGVKEPEIFVDLAAFAFCPDSGVRQRLLETLDVHRRLNIFLGSLEREVMGMRLKGQGLDGEQAERN